MKYSYQQLSDIQTDIEQFIDSEQDLSAVLLFNLRKNIKNLRTTQELIAEDFKSLDEDQSNKFQEFQQERLTIIEEFGGNIVDGRVANYSRLKAKDDFVDQVEQLAEKYEDTLDAAEQIETHNKEKAQEQVAEVEFNYISIDTFPETLNNLQETFLEFIKE